MGSSKFSFLIIFLIVNGWLSLTAEGLKCHVCHSGMKSCNSSVSTKEYLVECPGSTLACATITVEAPLNTESWFQRICLYPSDLTCFGIDRKELDDIEGIVKKPSGETLSKDIDCAKKERQKASLAELPGAPNSLRNKKGLTKPWMGIHTCQSADGCNSWDQPILFPYSVGYPAEENDNKMQPVSCYQCKVTDFEEPGAQGCIDLTQDVNSRNNEDIWERKKTLKTQGCKILSIYQPSASGMEPYFERSHWFPGDYWCLTRKYKSGAESRIQVGYDEDEDVIDEGASDDALTCREGYMRALESKANEEDEELSYSWSGQKVFQTSEEFSQFIKCLEQVRRKVANVMARSNPVQIPFNETAENAKITGRGVMDDDEPFAFVGFQICGPDDNCNDWSDEKLYGMMRNPPSRTPPTFSSTPSTSSTAPVTENSTAEEEVSSNSSPAPPASIAPRRKKGKKVTSSAPKIEVEDEEGSAARPEIPDKGCKIKKNQAGRLTLSGWLLISCMLIFH